MLFYKSGCRASAHRAAEGRTRLCRDQSNAMLALSPKESTEAVAACGIRFCVSSAETGANFATRGGLIGCGAVARLCRLSAVLGLKPPEHGVVCGAFFSGWGYTLPRFSSSKIPASIAFLRQRKNNATMQAALICHLPSTMQYEHSCNVAIFISG